MNLKEILAKNLKELRHNLRLSQEELAKRAGIGIGVIKQAEALRSWPAAENLEALAKGLGVRPADLLLDNPIFAETSSLEGRVLALEAKLSATEKTLGIPPGILEGIKSLAGNEIAMNVIRNAIEGTLEQFGPKAKRKTSAE